jgi:hypothetical protein
MAATLTVDVVMNATKAVVGLKKVATTAEDTAKKTSTSASKLATLGHAIAGAYAVEKVVDFGKEAVNAATNAAVANNRLAAIFVKTGAGGAEAAKAAEDYAEALGKQIGVAPVLIEGAQGILATFHSVSSASARQAGIFNGATKAAADLAAAGFGTLTGNAKLLGKALSDPAKGFAILKRSGVVLTAAQQQQIITMEKQGNLLGAQKVLLGDVNKAVGGTAAATATASSKMSVAWEEAQVKIGTKLLPAVNTLKADLLGFVNWVLQNSNWLGPLAIGIGVLGGAVAAVNITLRIWNGLLAAAKVATTIWTGVTKLATAAQWLLNAAIEADPLVILITAIVVVVAVLVVLIIKVKAVRQAFIDAFNWIKANWPLLVAILLGPVATAVYLIIRNWGTIRTALASVWHDVEAAASSAVRAITGFFSGFVGTVERDLAGLTQAIISPFQAAWQWISAHVFAPISHAISTIKSDFHTVFSGITSIWNPFARALNSIHLSIRVPTNFITKAAGLAGKGFDWRPPLHLPTFAQGGVFDQATLGVIGEAGREIVTPEKLLRQIVGSGGDVHLHINVPVTANPAEVGRHTVQALRAYVRANGPIAGLTT